MLTIDKDWCGLVSAGTGFSGLKYEIYGDLRIEEDVAIELEGTLTVYGHVFIGGNLSFPHGRLIAYGFIIVQGKVNVLHGLKSDSYIEANQDIITFCIDAGSYVRTEGRLYVQEHIYAGSYVRAAKSITAISIDARCYISAGEYIKTSQGVRAGENIEAGTFIDVNGPIFAGTYANATKPVLENIVKCKALCKGKIMYGELKCIK